MIYITYLNISHFTLPEFRNIKQMFYGCQNLIRLYLPNIDTLKISPLFSLVSSNILVKINEINYLYDDLIDEATYIDDLLNLNLNKINYIIINSVFYYFIIPVILGSLSESSNRISKKLALFLLIFFFINMKNESFKNCLFGLIFLEKITKEFEYFFAQIH